MNNSDLIKLTNVISYVGKAEYFGEYLYNYFKIEEKHPNIKLLDILSVLEMIKIFYKLKKYLFNHKSQMLITENNVLEAKEN
jgi:hypothetical protein